jgi:hypothetical protein
VIVLFLALTAGASDPGRASPSAIAQASALYREASEKAGGTYAERERAAEAMAAALTAYREGLDLLGDRAPAAERERLEALQKRFNREVGVLRAFADTALEDFDAVFSDAMQRALPRGTKVCEGTIPDGPALPGMPARTRPNPDCPGADRSADVARAMDADPALRAAVTEILALRWPELTVDATPQAPVGGATWIGVQPFARALLRDRLAAIDRADDAARVPLAAALEEGLDGADTAALVAQGRAITEQTARARAAAAAPLLAAAEARGPKVGIADPGWCANPAALGGCTGQPAPDAAIQGLRADKKVLKSR